jgi:hypothetical protein
MDSKNIPLLTAVYEPSGKIKIIGKMVSTTAINKIIQPDAKRREVLLKEKGSVQLTSL